MADRKTRLQATANKLRELYPAISDILKEVQELVTKWDVTNSRGDGLPVWVGEGWHITNLARHIADEESYLKAMTRKYNFMPFHPSTPADHPYHAVHAEINLRHKVLNFAHGAFGKLQKSAVRKHEAQFGRYTGKHDSLSKRIADLRGDPKRALGKINEIPLVEASAVRVAMKAIIKNHGLS